MFRKKGHTVAHGTSRAARNPMSTPRQVLSGRYYMLTRRCTQRQFLLRPDTATNNVFAYCLAEAAQRFGIELLLTQQMSNHHHTVLFDRLGTVVEFMAHFHKLVAKCQNALHGRWENLWSSEPPCLLHLVDTADVIDKLIYVATNPVKDGLVERVHHWPGINAVGLLLGERSLLAHCPRHFFREQGPMPAEVFLTLSIPPELGDRDQVLGALRKGISEVEGEQAQQRLATGRRVLGRRAILRQSWRDSPSSREPRRNLRPRTAARCRWARAEALGRNREFLTSYRAARVAWLAGTPIPFPVGTYWLRRLVGVPISS
ncbi:MAG: hypothetical protein NT062_08345 [Proteobacteria bacterium]|nr:hypothetical protein [Pseudomonadota bacterium]